MGVDEKIRELNSALVELSQVDREAISSFATMVASIHHEGALPPKYKELIALAIAVYRGCEHCIAFHLHQALGLGATSREVKEALLVALVMGGGTVSQGIVKALELLREEQQ